MCVLYPSVLPDMADKEVCRGNVEVLHTVKTLPHRLGVNCVMGGACTCLIDHLEEGGQGESKRGWGGGMADAERREKLLKEVEKDGEKGR